MINSSATPFLNFWHIAMIVGAAIMFLSGVVIYVVHKVKASAIKDYKHRYDYLNSKEIRNYKFVALCFALAVMMLINMYGMTKIDEMGVWFFVRFFISIAGGTLVGYVSYLVLDYYYPTVLYKKLNKWRYTPRISSKGNKMRLLSEEEEDVHLEEGMQAEEKAFSIDYDVWMDEESGEVKVEKYPGHLQATKCNNCGFYTMRVVKEEITQPVVGSAPGELIKHYQCSYCKSIRATAFKISTKDYDDYQLLASAPGEVKKNRNVSLVRIEIHSNVSGTKYFEFPTTDQAEQFLKEYDDNEA